MNWWYCLKHAKVEEGPGCANDSRLGPFATEAEAANAIQHAKERNKEWDAADADWDKGKSWTSDNE